MESYIAPEELAKYLPIDRGDSVLVASDVTYLCWLAYREGKIFDLDRLIDCLQEKLGAEGTLLFPTYNWKFCKGIPFDYRKTKSEVGSFSQAALNRKDFTRTRHALYSFAVWGKDRDLLVAKNDSNSFVGDTPFDYLYHNNSKMVILNAKLCFTFMHYVEETIGVDYRFCKEFHGEYIDADGHHSQRMYSMYVRYLDDRTVQLHPCMDQWCLEAGVFHDVMNPYIPIWCSRFEDAYAVLAHDIESNHSRHMVSFTGTHWKKDGCDT